MSGASAMTPAANKLRSRAVRFMSDKANDIAASPTNSAIIVAGEPMAKT